MRRAFTLIELLVVISIIALLIAILLPALGQARLSTRKLQNNVSLRSLHQATVIYAEGNKQWYQGMGSDGNPLTGPEVTARTVANGNFWNNPGHWIMPRIVLLAHDDVIAYEHFVNPQELNQTRLIWDTSGPLSHRFFSYAALDVGPMTSSGSEIVPAGGNASHGAWRATGNSQTPIFSDRNTATSAQSPPSADPGKSVWDSTKWMGGVAWNDGHTTFENSPVMARTSLPNRDIVNDPLFDDPTNSELGLSRSQHVRMIKINDNGTYGMYPDATIAP